MSKEIDRRTFLKGATVTVLGALVGGCGKSRENSPTPTVTANQAENLAGKEKTPTPTATAPHGFAENKATPTLEPTEAQKPGEWYVVFSPDAPSWVRKIGEEYVSLPLDPNWKTFPNVDNPKYNFRKEDGLEYGMAENEFRGPVVKVAPFSYQLISGDYIIPGVDKCALGTEKAGCAIILCDVGEKEAVFSGVSVNNGFTVEGRYWNGKTLGKALWALASHTAHKMLNVEGGVNEGGNCGSPNGCERVRIAMVLVDGNKVLAKAITTVER